MYAIIKSGGRQHKVVPGQSIRVDKIKAPEGADVTLGNVLLFSDDSGLKVGAPYIDGLGVLATVLTQGKAKKILVFKKKRRQGYHKARGHRQRYTALRIEAIGDADALAAIIKDRPRVAAPPVEDVPDDDDRDDEDGGDE